MILLPSLTFPSVSSWILPRVVFRSFSWFLGQQYTKLKTSYKDEPPDDDAADDNVNEELDELEDATVPEMVYHLDYAPSTCTDRRDSGFANENALSDHKEDLLDNNDDDNNTVNANDEDGKVEETL